MGNGVDGYVYGYSCSESEPKLEHKLPCDFDPLGELAAGDMIEEATDEILLSGTDSRIRIADPEIHDRILDEVARKIPGKDVVYLMAHGNPYRCGEVFASDVPRLNLEDHNRFVYATSCGTGDYEDSDAYGIAEKFLAQGAAVYVGATETSCHGANKEAGRWMFDAYWTAGRTTGQALTDLKRDKLSLNEAWRLWAWEYNLCGDPKFGAAPVSVARDQGELTELLQSSPSSLHVEIPDYDVTTEEGVDYVQIPGGALSAVEGEPEVPYWSISEGYPTGTTVQDVELAERSGLVFTTGLSLPTAVVRVGCPEGSEEAAGVAVSESQGWFPEEDYGWEVVQNPDGSSTLNLVIYPFDYNAQTTGARFYNGYVFDIEVVAPTVAVHALETDQETYAQGDPVSVELWLKNSGDPQDVIVDAVIAEETSDQVIDGLILDAFDGLSGLASFDTMWDGSGVGPGQYAVDVEVRDTVGNVLDRAQKRFELGIYSGEVTSFTAEPGVFCPGETVSLLMTFQNMGTVPINATATLEVQELPGLATTAVFTRAIAGLAPSASAVLADDWETSGAADSSYRVVGRVQYHSTSTDSVFVEVSTAADVYLPLVLKLD